LEETHRAHTNEHYMTEENLKANRTDLENLKTSKPLLDEQYVYFQEMKAYIRDFVDCYNEKIVEIDKAELKWKDLYKHRADTLAARRQQAIRDQTVECSNSGFQISKFTITNRTVKSISVKIS
jgi:hypothetical protein